MSDDSNPPRLAQRLVKRHGSGDVLTRGRSPRATFISLLDEIREAAEWGWSLRAVWQQLRDEERFAASYTTFLSLAKRYAIESQKQPKQAPNEAKTLPPSEVSKPAQLRRPIVLPENDHDLV